MSKDESNIGMLLVAAATVGFSFKGIVAQLAYAEGMSVEQLLVIRSALTILVFWTVTLVTCKAAGRRPPRGRWRDCGTCGLLFFAAAYCDLQAVALAGASISRIVLFTFPAILLGLEWLRLRTPPPRPQVVGFLLSYAGMLLVVLPVFGEGPDHVKPSGLLFSLAGALSYALFLQRSQSLVHTFGSIRFNTVTHTLAFACMAVFIGPRLFSTGLAPSAPSVGWALIIAVFCTALPLFLMFEGLPRLGASRAGIVTLFGPGLTLILAWMLFDEILTPAQLLGFAIITLGMLSLQGIPNPSRRRRIPADEPCSTYASPPKR